MPDRASNLKPVYITSVGIVSPAGTNTEATWRVMSAGARCVKAITDRALTGGGVACVGQVPGFVPPPGMENADRVCQLAVAAADQAVAGAGLCDSIYDDVGGNIDDSTGASDHISGRIGCNIDPARMAVSFGTSKGGIFAFSSAIEKFKEVENSQKLLKEYNTSRTSNQQNPLNATYGSYFSSTTKNQTKVSIEGKNLLMALSDTFPDASARRLAARYGITGGAHATVAACATGTLAVIRAVQMIKDGLADIVLAGAADASIHPLWLAAFRRMGVLAAPHAELGEKWACRPFDRHRSGFAVAEGAAALVLESAESVRRRGAQPLAHVCGYAMGSDPAGLTAVDAGGGSLAEVISLACRRANATPARIAAIQAHGTGTVANDLAEIAAMRSCGLCDGRIPVASFKGSLGHLLGAAGAVELAISVLARRDGLFPGNPTLLEPDAAMAPAWLSTQTVTLGPGPVLKTSLGFGGHLAAVILDTP